MRVITLARYRALTGTTTTPTDEQVNAVIPEIDSIVKQITGNRFNYRIIGSTTTDSNRVTVASIQNNTLENYQVEDLQEYLQVGQLITGDGIPADTYISEVYYNIPVSDYLTTDIIPEIDLSANATETNAGVALYLGANLAQQRIIAKGISYLIAQTSTTAADNTWTSRTMGPVTVTRDGKIDARFGMPSWFVKAFDRYHGGH